MSKIQSVTAFEDDLTREYRGLLRELPLEALLGGTLDPDELIASLPAFFRYFDLSNEQAFLVGLGRIRQNTWANWLDGICQHVQRPAFRAAWEEIRRRRPDSFDELSSIAAFKQALAAPLRVPDKCGVQPAA